MMMAGCAAVVDDGGCVRQLRFPIFPSPIQQSTSGGQALLTVVYVGVVFKSELFFPITFPARRSSFNFVGIAPLRSL